MSSDMEYHRQIIEDDEDDIEKSVHVPVSTTTSTSVQEFRDTSIRFHSLLSKQERLDQGIFFSPRKARDQLFNVLMRIGIIPTSILEPSFGTGEFLLDAKQLYPHAKLYGVEKNEQLFQSVTCQESRLTCGDFLEWKGMVDLVIGNPPYFVMKLDHLSTKEKRTFMKTYEHCMTGRPNIYILFLYKCLTEHLQENGVLAFIIPTSLCNCVYYQPMRNYIQTHTTILHLETLCKPGFFETGQETMLLVLQKGKRNDDYVFTTKTGKIYLSPFYKELYECMKDTTTLSELGFGVKTGNVVWNEVKDKLADEGTLLIYSNNITNCTLQLTTQCGRNEQKKQYVKDLDKSTISGPVILVDRGYGNSFHFNFVKVDLPLFYVENHLNVIYPKTRDAERNFDMIIKSFKDERHMKFISWFLGNGSLPATDLETLVPIFL